MGSHHRRSAAAAFAAATLTLAGCGEATVPTVRSAPTTSPAAAAHSTPATKPDAEPHRATTRAASPSASRAPTLAHMIGQTIVGRFAGPVPPAAFLDQIRSGELGGVILFTENVGGGEAATHELDQQLQRTAKEGGNPPLLIMTDQEGGEVKRLAWAPPELAAAEMRSTAVAEAEGAATGAALRAVGINVDLAPVADVVRIPNSWLGTRSFGSNPTQVAERACAFAAGIASQGVAFTLKHFPGLGRALTSTDVQPTTVNATAAEIHRDYQPYIACGNSLDGLVMVNSAIYPNLTGTSVPAVLSPEIYDTELPLATGGHPITISDDLQAAALANEATPGQRAMKAGLDILLYAQTAQASLEAFQSLLAVAEAGGIPQARIQEAYEAVETIKERVAGASVPATDTGSSASSAGEASSYPEDPGAPETIEPEHHSGTPGK